MSRKCWYVPGLFLIILLAACQSGQSGPSQPISGDALHADLRSGPTPTPGIVIVSHVTTPVPTPRPSATKSATHSLPPGHTGAAPYGPPPAMTGEESQLTQQLFALINSDRAARGLYAYSWNATLAAGARLHSWNMYHCGFSHTCPDGRSQCQRISDEGFTYTDCGECIGYAGPFPTPWGGVHNIQESMVNEPPTGWHRIHLLSKTLHRVGVGIYVDPGGYIWFTEDLVS